MNIYQFLQSDDYENFSINVNEIATLDDCIVFVFSSWSSDFVYLKLLLNCLKQRNTSIKLHVLDIDDKSCRDFERRFGILNHGRGEIYLIRDNTIQSQILTHSENSELKINELLD